MNPLRYKKTLAAVGVAATVLTTVAWRGFSGSPKWSTGNYTADLNTISFPAGSVWDSNAQYSLSDWRDMGDTSFGAFLSRTNSDYNDHGNGRNSWVWLNRPSDGWLGVTYVRWSGSNLTDCDIWYNSRSDYSWTNGLFDPCEYRSYWPIEFRNVARHETGHAIGFDHEERTLANMNAISTHGAGIQHVQGSGLLPHADEKNACRTYYPASTTVRNVMATNWREPGSHSVGAPQESQETGTWAANTTRTIEFWLSNQSNVTIPGLSGGIRTGIYLSTNDIISTGDTRIYETTYGGDWGAHASGRYTPTVRVPDAMPAGSYYVGVFFDNNGSVAESGTGATESDNTCVLGQVTVTNSLRTLNVSAVNGPSAPIQVSTADSQNRTNGNASFSRTYWGSTQSVTLTAPAAVGNNPFRFWRLNGVDQRPNSGRTLTVTMDGTENAVAVFWRNVAGSEVSFGRPGCPGTNRTVPVHSVTHANGAQGNQQGTTTSYNVSSARPQSQALLHIGLNRLDWNGTRLPLDLGFIGMNGCFLNHEILDSPVVLTSSRGTASIQFTWPVDPAAVGASVYTTYAIVDPGSNNLGIVHSNSMRTIIGGNVQ